jgi:hypothetical protein
MSLTGKSSHDDTNIAFELKEMPEYNSRKRNHINVVTVSDILEISFPEGENLLIKSFC